MDTGFDARTLINLQTDAAVTSSYQVPRIPNVQNVKEARKAAQEFEAVFISQMLKPLFESVEVEPPFGGGSGEEVWKGLQVEEYGKAIARAGGIGLADHIFAEILKMQEVR
ncbi:MAG: hypothetical protein CFH06_00213 [Alphaproteobacteria bacterium MarineAlpha3_Bin5]|nr:MAG: hypothetical protein CFH06_00213 [Alphaproteobacteria bacterium MarineAlpha3_Bin5]